MVTRGGNSTPPRYRGERRGHRTDIGEYVRDVPAIGLHLPFERQVGEGLGEKRQSREAQPQSPQERLVEYEDHGKVGVGRQRGIVASQALGGDPYGFGSTLHPRVTGPAVASTSSSRRIRGSTIERGSGRWSSGQS